MGAAEIFDSEVPSYRSAGELQALLRRYLDNEAERRGLAHRLRERVLARHTYRHRARALKMILILRSRRGYRVAFKIQGAASNGTPQSSEADLARALGRSLAAHGHSFRIDRAAEWDRSESLGDDVVNVFRGAGRYRPKSGQINLFWDISEADNSEDEEYDAFDHVFVSSHARLRNLPVDYERRSARWGRR